MAQENISGPASGSSVGAPAPVICTLDPKQRSARVLDWSDVGALALTKDQVADGVVSTFALTVADQIEDLANREMACCGTWLKITTEREGDVIRLTLRTDNPDGLAMIHSIASATDVS